MSLLNNFYEYIEQLGIKKDDLYSEKGDDFTVVTFGEEVEQGVLYNVGLVFYESEENVEVYIRKTIKDYDLFSVLKKINELNAAGGFVVVEPVVEVE